MAIKCKIIESKPALRTVVFSLRGKAAWICGTYKEYDGYVYVEEHKGALVSVDKPEPIESVEGKPKAKPKRSASSNAVKLKDAIASEE